MRDDDFELEQMPFTASRFAENPEPRCPCILLLDTSGSMSGEPLRQLNEGYAKFINELIDDPLAAKRVEVCVVNFGPVQMHQDFSTPDEIHPEDLTVTGDTPMGAAIEFALEELKARKTVYQEAGVSYYRPWVFLITDGAPTDSWTRAAAAIREGGVALCRTVSLAVEFTEGGLEKLAR